MNEPGMINRRRRVLGPFDGDAVSHGNIIPSAAADVHLQQIINHLSTASHRGYTYLAWSPDLDATGLKHHLRHIQ